MDLRIRSHPILDDYEKGKEVTFWFDGREMTGYEGEPIAAALHAQGVMIHRYTKKLHQPRGIFAPSAGAPTASWWWTGGPTSAPA